MQNCILCKSKNLQEIILKNDKRRYFNCFDCSLIFVHSDFHLSKEVEKSRYEFHNNGIEHEGYVNFLNRSITPTLPFLNVEMVGLDYGCGPRPTLSELLSQHGIKCYNYDPVFEIDHPFKSYDFIFATECMEHFFHPATEIKNIISLLKSKGYISIMTERWTTLDKFKDWYYKSDPTHVSFFHQYTFRYIIENWNLEKIYEDADRVIILRKA